MSANESTQGESNQDDDDVASGIDDPEAAAAWRAGARRRRALEEWRLSSKGTSYWRKAWTLGLIAGESTNTGDAWWVVKAGDKTVASKRAPTLQDAMVEAYEAADVMPRSRIVPKVAPEQLPPDYVKPAGALLRRREGRAQAEQRARSARRRIVPRKVIPRGYSRG